MAMEEPSGDTRPQRKNDQLISPRLTPVSEELPIDQASFDRTNGGDDAVDESAVDLSQEPPVTNGTRSRSASLPSKYPKGAVRENGTTSPRRATVDRSSDAKRVSQREVLKLSSAQLQELTSSPGYLPIRSATFSEDERAPYQKRNVKNLEESEAKSTVTHVNRVNGVTREDQFYDDSSDDSLNTRKADLNVLRQRLGSSPLSGKSKDKWTSSRGASTATSLESSTRESRRKGGTALEVQTEDGPRHGYGEPGPSSANSNSKEPALLEPLPPDLPQSLPLPPYSLPTHLHLELSTERPSPLYIHQSSDIDIPYEPTSVKIERLLNFLLLPPQLERVLLFGALTCLDAWLHTFTILPLRFLKALWMLIQNFVSNIFREVQFLASFVYKGLGRVWHRRGGFRSASETTATSQHSSDSGASQVMTPPAKEQPKQANGTARSASKDYSTNPVKRHRRARSVPSLLQPRHKADLLQGALIVVSCSILINFDASKMYHSVRGQSAIKLYVIYNALEVFDRLLSALGQDIMECLLSPETLERKPNGRSKIIKPFYMFLLALAYTVGHATAFFYQVITLNVAINSHSNALLTLLMSNQFVEIKGAVFKRFEKENLFQMTCADVVERFQLWLVLVIIGLRNVVELFGISVGSTDSSGSSNGGNPPGTATHDTVFGAFGIPASINLLQSLFPAHVLGPVLLVLGSEMLVDWLKHAYITKFNAISPALYGRFFDVLAKDYYSHAFSTQGLIRRLGLPVIPLACLFIRAILQTYHMFLASTITPPIGNSTATSLSLDSDPTASPALAQIDHIFRSALGRSSFGGGLADATTGWWRWNVDDVIALATMLVFFLALYLLLLALKLMLGMLLLGVARSRYRGMRRREQERVVETNSKRRGPWGVAEVGEERRRKIYEGDPEGLQALRDKEAKVREKEKETRQRGLPDKLDSVERYRMIAKRIW